VEDGLVVGNTYDKYGTKNPISRILVRGFFRSLDRLVARSGKERILEIGCGEGHLAVHLAQQGKQVSASDISRSTVDKARALSAARNVEVEFFIANIYDLDAEAHRCDLVVCCEVLEHLEDPERALRILLEMANPYLLVSVPREPIWRLLNFCRLRYLPDLGNTPGHIQHWSQRSFLDFIRQSAEIVQVDSPFPWTMVLARTGGGG
jgi:SAM-dependent methyltransferase